MRRVALSLAASVLTAGYWWVVFIAVYADQLFAGDRNPALDPPPEHEVLARTAAVLVVGVLAYAGLALVWQRLTRRRRH